MKFNILKQTFKNGMVSPRLRGREKEGDTGNSAEKLENFIVDKVGGLTKRSALEFPLRQPFKSSTYGANTFDSYPVASSTLGVEYFSVNLKGRNFQFRFNTSKAQNSVRGTVNATTVAHYQSDFLNVVELMPSQPSLFLGDSGYKDVRPFAPYVTGSFSYTANADLTAFSFSITTGANDSTYLPEYLNTVFHSGLSMTKITDRTVLFVSRNVSRPSFTVSLIDLPTLAGGTATTEVFVILPYFVNLKIFTTNLGKALSSSNYLCPIAPSNFPFNAINTVSSHTVDIQLNTSLGTQNGAVGVNGALASPVGKLVYDLYIPLSACVDSIYPYGTDVKALIGKFVNVPTTNALQDLSFFVTAHHSTSAGIARFYCIRVVDGDSVYSNPYAPSPSTTQWKVSTFGGQAHPKAANYAFGRLLYGNDGIEQSRWWASGIHPDNILNFQGFMEFFLAQDVISDVSRMNYSGVAIATTKTNYVDYGIIDPYRYGFTGRVPNLSPISFIESRTKIHFGTLAGETQLIINNGTFQKESYDQTIIRTNSATPYATTKGDGKFFYISNGAKDIRFISTEDKYYESLDGLMTTGLEGLGLHFNKIEWFEALNSIIARTTTNRIFIITVHEDTQVKAISEIKSELTLLDFFCNLDDLYIVTSHKNYQLVSRYLGEQYLAGDYALVYDGYYTDYTYAYPPFLGDTLYIFYNGVEYTMTVPANGSTPTPPVDPTLATSDNPIFVYGKKVTAKLRTMPLSEGGGNNSAVGDKIRIDRATVQVDGSGPFKIGNEGGTIYDVEGQSLVTMQTKFINFDMPQSPEIENHLYIETDKPTPLNISGISFRGVSYSGE